MQPIYVPKGRAKEYGAFALNIYTGCTHGCTYCYAPATLRKDRETFSSNVVVRPGVVEAAQKQLATGEYKGRRIHLCFTCDPYPKWIDTTPTREIIKAIKDAGAHVQILTKAGERAHRDFDLLDNEDWFGVTISGNDDREREPYTATYYERCRSLIKAKSIGANTWVSCEPVFDPEVIYKLIRTAGYIDLFKIGKLNHRDSDIDWGEFGHKCEELCKEYGRAYYIKEDLREKMKKGEQL